MMPLSYDALTERINAICHRLEHYHFLTKKEKDKLLKELTKLIKERDKIKQALHIKVHD